MKKTCRHNSGTTKKSNVYYTCECGTIYDLYYLLNYSDIQQKHFLKINKQKNCKPIKMSQFNEEMEKHENDIMGFSPVEDINLEKNCGKRKINSLNGIGEISMSYNEVDNDHNLCCNNKKERRVRHDIGDTGFPFNAFGDNAHNITVSDDVFHCGGLQQACPFACCQNKWKRGVCGEENVEQVQLEKQEEEIIKKEDNLEENACFYSRGSSCNTSNTFYLEINALLKELHFLKMKRSKVKKKDDDSS